MADSVCRKDENYCPKVFLEKCNSNDCYNVDSDEEYFDDSADSYEKIPMKKIATKKIRVKKIKCIDLFLEETSDLTSIHSKMHEIFVFQLFQEKSFFEKI